MLKIVGMYVVEMEGGIEFETVGVKEFALEIKGDTDTVGGIVTKLVGE